MEFHLKTSEMRFDEDAQGNLLSYPLKMLRKMKGQLRLSILSSILQTIFLGILLRTDPYISCVINDLSQKAQKQI